MLGNLQICRAMHTTSNQNKPSTVLARFSARFGTRRRYPSAHAPGAFAPSEISDAVATSLTRPVPENLPRRSARHQEKRTRRRDLAIAVIVSALAHGALAWLPEDTPPAADTSAHAREPVEIAVIEMPEFEETPIDVAENEPSDIAPAEFAPPMQADLPSLVSIDSFVQPMQPPAPAGISTDASMLVVPPTVQIGHGGNAPKLFDMAELDRVPNRIRTGPLSYPQEFLRSRTEGDVVLLLVIDSSGRVKVDRILESSHPEFTRAAVKAAELSLYESPIKGGVAVSARYTLRVPFRLAGG